MNSKKNDVVFSGKGFEYFQICIVNLFLTIITLGIYSAWATVRANQYLYGHTSIDGHSFQYHATPIQILKSRLIAVALLILYTFSSSISPLLSLALSLLLLCFIPWMIVQGLKFKTQMTSYRNVRFDFSGTKKDAFLYYLLYPLLSVFTLYLVLPWVIKKQLEFSIGNRHYGEHKFSVSLSNGSLYKIVGLSIAPIILLVIGIALLAAPSPEKLLVSLIHFPIYFVAFFALFLIVSTIYSTLIWRETTRNTIISEIASFDSNLTVIGMLQLNFTNIIAIVCTLGLALPWTVVRSMRYACSHTQYQLEPKLEEVVGKADLKESALGDEVSNLFDVSSESII